MRPHTIILHAYTLSWYWVPLVEINHIERSNRNVYKKMAVKQIEDLQKKRTLNINAELDINIVNCLSKFLLNKF